MILVCPNEECLAHIDMDDLTCDAGQYDGQDTVMTCPSCGLNITVTTHIDYTAVLTEDPK